MSAILIAGGAGEFGSSLAEKVSSSSRVVSIDLLLQGDSSRVKFGPLVKVDVRETPRVVRAAKENAVTHLFHCAMKSGGDAAAEIDQHLTTTMSLLQAARELRVGLTIFAPEGRTFEMISRIVTDCRAAGVADAEVISWSDENALPRALARANSGASNPIP